MDNNEQPSVANQPIYGNEKAYIPVEFKEPTIAENAKFFDNISQPGGTYVLPQPLGSQVMAYLTIAHSRNYAGYNHDKKYRTSKGRNVLYVADLTPVDENVKQEAANG